MTQENQMSPKPSSTRRQFIQRTAAITLGTVLVQSCAEPESFIPETGSDPSSPENPDPAAPDTTDASDPSAPDSADASDPSAPDSADASDPAAPDSADASDPSSDPSSPDEICELTSSDIEGPFYRDNPPHRAQLVTADEPGRALVIAGTVFAADCETPLAGAVVDVWHADDEGEYDNTSDAFRMRGQMTTNEDGYYEFSTIRPGRYPNAGTYRPEHIHFKVTYQAGASDTASLTTQLYFENDPFLDSDPWAVPERTIALSSVDEDDFTGRFDVVLPVTI
jgi:catechol 1,2-dioxygenase